MVVFCNYYRVVGTIYTHNPNSKKTIHTVCFNAYNVNRCLALKWPSLFLKKKSTYPKRVLGTHSKLKKKRNPAAEYRYSF